MPEYRNLIQGREMLQFYKDQLDEGRDITIFDFDGPRTPEGEVSCVKLSEDLLIEKINDTRYPFGHGYVIASILAGIPIERYCMYNRFCLLSFYLFYTFSHSKCAKGF